MLEAIDLETATKRLYEGMFLVDSGRAARDWAGVMNAIETILAKSDAEIVSLQKWDERPLAYAIGKVERGTYILAYFRLDRQRVREIEREVKLSERIMRALILSAEDRTEADISKDTPAMRTKKQLEQARARSQASRDAEAAAAKAKSDEASTKAEPTAEDKSDEASTKAEPTAEDKSDEASKKAEPAAENKSDETSAELKPAAEDKSDEASTKAEPAAEADSSKTNAEPEEISQ